jgi:hypothetical protein
MSIRARDFDLLVNKFGFQTRDTGDKQAWLEYEGQVVVRAKRSHTRGRDLPFQHSIRQQLKLNEDELRQALQCTLDRDGYVELLRRKGVI